MGPEDTPKKGMIRVRIDALSCLFRQRLFFIHSLENASYRRAGKAQKQN